MKTLKFLLALIFFVACTTASAGIVTLFQGASPLTISSNSDNVVAAQSFSATSTGILVDLTFTFTGSVDNNDFLGLWLGYDTTGTANDKNLTTTHTSGPNFGIKGNGGSGSTTSDIFVRATGESGSWISGSNVTSGTAYHLLAYLYKTNGSTSYNHIDAWLNPTAQEVATLTGADVSLTQNSNLSTVNEFGFRSANLDVGDSITVSNVTIQAVPEPGTVALAGIALVGLAGVARRKKSA